MKKVMLFQLMLLIILCGCGLETQDPISSDELTGSIVFNVTWPKRLYVSKLTAIQEVSSITAYVYWGVSEVTHKDLEHEGNRGKANITVTANDNYQVFLAAFDNSSVKYIGSDEDVDVTAGETTTVDIEMVDVTPILNTPTVTGDTNINLLATDPSLATGETGFSISVLGNSTCVVSCIFFPLSSVSNSVSSFFILLYSPCRLKISDSFIQF